LVHSTKTKGRNENVRILTFQAYDTTYLGQWFSVFRRDMLPSFSNENEDMSLQMLGNSFPVA